MNTTLSSVNILGTNITNASKKQILEYISKKLHKGTEKFYIVTPNPEILMLAVRQKSYQAILNQARVSLPDGIGVVISGRILKKQLKYRISGVDFMDDLCCEASKRGFVVGFLGGRGKVAELSAKCLIEKYPRLVVGFANDEWDERKLTKKNIDLLFVAFGFPRQEQWIAKNLANINVRSAMGVGGAFDYFSGKVPRAPKVIQSLGCEWAFRLMIQPWRIKRQLKLIAFPFYILKEKLAI